MAHTMTQYSRLCSREQTHQAFMLGAPIETWATSKLNYEAAKERGHQLYFDCAIIIEEEFRYIVGRRPTEEQMLWWLRTKGFRYSFQDYSFGLNVTVAHEETLVYNQPPTIQNGTYADAINKSLDYLEQLEKERRRKNEND